MFKSLFIISFWHKKPNDTVKDMKSGRKPITSKELASPIHYINNVNCIWGNCKNIVENSKHLKIFENVPKKLCQDLWSHDNHPKLKKKNISLHVYHPLSSINHLQLQALYPINTSTHPMSYFWKLLWRVNRFISSSEIAYSYLVLFYLLSCTALCSEKQTFTDVAL